MEKGTVSKFSMIDLDVSAKTTRRLLFENIRVGISRFVGFEFSE
jgi:hypothetical protein